MLKSLVGGLSPLTNRDITVLPSPLLPPSGDVREQDPSRIESLKVILAMYKEILSFRSMNKQWNIPPKVLLKDLVHWQ